MHLRGARKNCRKRYGRNDSRGRLAGKIGVEAEHDLLDIALEAGTRKYEAASVSVKPFADESKRLMTALVLEETISEVLSCIFLPNFYFNPILC